MHRSLVSLALVAAFPAFGQIHACPGQKTTTYVEGDCPPVKSAGAAPVVAAVRASGGGAVDAPLDIVETGVPAITQLAGRFTWLDDDTLAITTFADPHAKAPWMVRKIVAFDVASHAVTPLVPRGFIDCSNVGVHLVSLEIGDLESRFAVASKAPPAVQQFDIWNPDTHTLSPAPAEFKEGWHPAACLKPAPEDLAQHDLLGSPRPVRYLLPEHGTLAWGNLDENGHPEGPSLRTPKKKVVLALSINDISHDVRWLPWRHAYQLEAGVHDRTMDPPRDVPLITMDVDGRLARHAIPAGLTQQLDAAGAPAPALMIATQGGDLVVQPGSAANGGGFYLVQGDKSRRIWCTAKAAPGQAAGDQACAMSQPVAVSPDGCRIAFDAKPAAAIANGFADAPTVKVMTLCEPPKASGKGDASARRKTSH